MFLPLASVQDFQSLQRDRLTASWKHRNKWKLPRCCRFAFYSENKFISGKSKRPQGTISFMQWEEFQNTGFRRMEGYIHTQGYLLKFLYKALLFNDKDFIPFQMNIPAVNFFSLGAQSICVFSERAAAASSSDSTQTLAWMFLWPVIPFQVIYASYVQQYMRHRPV